MLELVDRAESIYSNNLNPGENKYLGEALSYFFTVYKYAHKTSKDLFEHIDNKLLEFLGSSKKEKDALVKQFFRKDDPWTKTSTTEIIASLQPKILDRPFNDIGIHRTISWKALGITWHIEFKNTFELTPIVEGIIATLQIMVIELAGLDLSLLPTSVHLNVIYNEDKIFELSEMFSNKATKSTITLSNKFEKLTLDQIKEYIVRSALTILQSCSLHPHEKLGEIFENLVIEDFQRKVFTIRPYHELWCAILPEDCFNFEVRHSLESKASEICWDIQEHEALQAFKGKGIAYKKEQSLLHIKSRYENTIKPIRITLKRLVLDKGFNRNIEKFRSNKLLDWHILVVVFNIIANHKANQHDTGLQDLKKRADFVSSWMQQEQVEDDLSIQPELFTLENLQLHWKSFLPTVLKTIGLDIPNSTPDVEAIEQFLEERYNFFIDDVDHDKIFTLIQD